MSRVTVEPCNNGPESRDFAQMLDAMYANWDGPVEQEAGVHSLTYRSPFDEEHRRHTTFAVIRVDEKDPPDGTPTRRYVLEPYTRVRDYSLKRETEDAAGVLAGNLSLLLDGDDFDPTPAWPVNPRPLTPEDQRRAEELVREMGWA